MIQTLKKVSLTAVTFLCAIPLAHAVLINPIGRVTSGVAADADTGAKLSNSIIARINGTDPSAFDIAGRTYTVLDPSGAPLPFADPNVTTFGSAASGTIDLTGSNAGFCFALVKYDGAQGSALLFDIRGLTSLMVPTTSGDGTNFGPNQYRLFGCLDVPTSVPDGGTTLMLLGLSVGGVELLRRAFLKRSATI